MRLVRLLWGAGHRDDDTISLLGSIPLVAGVNKGTICLMAKLEDMSQDVMLLRVLNKEAGQVGDIMIKKGGAVRVFNGAKWQSLSDDGKIKPWPVRGGEEGGERKRHRTGGQGSQ